MPITSIRDNTVQQGGATNPAGYDNSVASVKMSRLTEEAYIERFRDVTDFNVLDQAPISLSAGEESTFKINNIGFLKSTKAEVNGSFTITASGAATIEVPNDFPFNIISRVVSQFNGGTTTHSATPYNLFALDLKRNKGKKFEDYERTASAITTTSSVALSAINGYLNKAISSDLLNLNITGTGTPTFTVQSGKYNSLTGITSITMANGQSLTFNFTLTIPINYTYSDSLLYGLIPLQNNSVFLETKLIANSVISSYYSSCLYADSTSRANVAVSAYNVNVIPHNEFFSVPSVTDGGVELYSELIRYNYIITDQNITVNSSAPDDALSYIIPNNSYLSSILLTVRNASTKKLQEIKGLLEKVFIDYNGTAVVRKNTVNYDLMKFATQYDGGLPFGFGQFLKDFANIGGTENSGVWADFLDLYSANSPTLKSGVTLPSGNPVDVLITREMVVPTSVNVI